MTSNPRIELADENLTRDLRILVELKSLASSAGARSGPIRRLVGAGWKGFLGISFVLLFVHWANADDPPARKGETEPPSNKQKRGATGVVHEVIDGITKAVEGAAAKAVEELYTKNEQHFLAQVYVPVIGPDSLLENRRLGAWLLGQEPAQARGDLIPVMVLMTSLEADLSDPRKVPEVLRAPDQSRPGSEVVKRFARLKSMTKTSRVVIIGIVEQQSATDKEEIHLYNVQIEFELTNNLFVRKSHAVTEIK